MAAAVAGVRGLLAGVAGVPLWSLDAEQTGDLVERVGSALAALAGLRLRLLAHAETAGVAERAGAPSLPAWLRAQCRTDPREAAGQLRLARALESRYRATGAALAAGRVTAEQARVVVAACQALPREVAEAVRGDAEAHLLAQAAHFDPLELARLGRRILEVVVPEEADRLLAAQLAREEARAARRELCRIPDGTGGLILRGHLDPEGAALVEAALDPLAAPAPATEAGPDPRSAAHRYADALVELCRRALAGAPEAGGPLPGGGEPATLIVTIDLDRLRAGLGAALLPSGDALSAATARRLGCDARLLPAVLGGPSQVLDLGRSRRLFSPAQRHALTLRDGGCAFPGCHRPPAWCQLHHIRHWADGGPTDLGNAVMLCDHHHQLIHHGHWAVRIADDGLPEFTPPAWIDPHRKPRRNTRTHHRQRAA